jgi:hypothetical protein
VPSKAVCGTALLAVNLEVVHPAAAAGPHVSDGVPAGAVGVHFQRAARRQPHVAGGLQVDAAGALLTHSDDINSTLILHVK